MAYIDNPLNKKYNEYLELLDILCRCYDQNEKDIIALPISTAIRVLMHDTKNSTSLLTHLEKKNIQFVSTNVKERRGGVHLGLIRQINAGVTDGVGGEAKYWPLCDDRYFPSPPHSNNLDQKLWWEEEIIFQSGESILTRKDLVLAMANKDGGAHFDTKVQKKYDDFRHTWSGGSSLVGTKSQKKRGYDNVPVYPAVRQIGFEILCTLKT